MKDKKKKELKNGKLNSNVNHRELLTFNNLTNLEWQFVELYDKTTGKKKNNTFLNDILSTPKSFIKGYEDPIEKTNPIYAYGTDNEDNFLGEAEAKADLRKNAGIAMEYLEKWEEEENQRSKFIADWEVIYGADNYKVVKDYIDHLNNTVSNSTDELCPSRDKIDTAKKQQVTIKASFDITGLTLSVAIWNGMMKGAEKIVAKNLFKKSTEELKTEVIKKTVTKLIKKTSCLPLSIISAAYFNRESAGEILNAVGEEAEAAIMKELKEKGSMVDIINALGQRTTVEITRKLNMFDTGFRVVVLKKGDTIVVAYKGKRVKDNKLLPEEFDYLQIVYDKLRRDYAKPESKIVFTGYEGGADLSFLNTLFARQEKNISATLFYNNLRELKNYVDFTPHDLNKNYKSNLQISLSSKTDKIRDEVFKTAFGAAVATGLADAGILGRGVTAGVTISNFVVVCAVIVLWEVISGIKDYFENLKIKEEYILLEKMGFIAAEKEFTNQNLTGSYFSGSPSEVKKRIKDSEIKIKGYITDQFLYHDYIELVVDNATLLPALVEEDKGSLETIKVKKEDAIFLLLKQQKMAEFMQKEVKIKKKNYNTTVMNRDYNIEYLVFKENVSNKEGAVTEIIKLYWALEKNKYGIYEIRALFDGDKTPRGIFEPLMPLSQREKKEIGKYKLMINLMEVMGIMQRNYIAKKNKLFSYIYPTQDGVRITKTIPSKSELEKEGREIKTEFAFMPYLKDDGNIDRLAPHLHDDYLASVFKSVLHKDKGYGSKALFQLRKIKYGLQPGIIEYTHEFSGGGKSFLEVDIDNKFLEIMESDDIALKLKEYGMYSSSPSPSYQNNIYVEKKIDDNYQLALQKIKKDPGILDKYYQIKKIEGHQKFKKATHVIEIHPKYKQKIEYKYNLFDYITGGELKLYVKDANKIKDDIVVTTPQDIKEVKKLLEKNREKNDGTAAKQIKFKETFADHPGIRKKKELISNLNKTSSISEIKAAAEIVISEAKRKRQPVIAASLEDYLSRMYTKKRIEAKALKTLDGIKRAEAEIKEKINQELSWEINDLLYITNEFVPHKAIEFEFGIKQAIRLIGRPFEEFLHTSNGSVLKAKAKFEVEKVPDRRELKLIGCLTYRWENNYRWFTGAKKLLLGYGFIDDFQFKKLAAEKEARPYKMYAQWSYYLEDDLSLLTEVDNWHYWSWSDYCSFNNLKYENGLNVKY